MKLFAAYNRYGYFETYLEGYIKAESKEQALKILEDRAKKFDKGDGFVAKVEELKPINLEKKPY